MLDELLTVFDLFTHEGFLYGLGAGVVLLALFFAASLTTKAPVPGWAVAVAGVVMLLLALQFETEQTLLIALAFVGVAGVFVDVAHSSGDGPLGKLMRIVAWAVLGVSIVWFAGITEFSVDPWVPVVFPLVILAIGATLRSARTTPLANLLGPMLAVSVFGIWVTVPETDMVVVLLGVLLPMGLATLPPVRARALAPGAFALAGVMAWLTVAGGDTRALSIVGGWAAIGVLPLLPALSLLGRQPPGGVLIFGLHVAYVVVVTRVVDIWDSIAVALLAIVVLTGLSALALVAGTKPAGAVDARQESGTRIH